MDVVRMFLLEDNFQVSLPSRIVLGNYRSYMHSAMMGANMLVASEV